MEQQVAEIVIIADAKTLAEKCRREDESCTLGDYVDCPLNCSCNEVTKYDWEKVLKAREIPFRKGELVAVKDDHQNTWDIKVFHSYNNDEKYHYRVFTSLENLTDSGSCINYKYCEKLSAFSKKFFIG